MNKQSPGYVILFMLALCLVFGFGISIVNYATLPVLKKNEILHKNKITANAFMLDLNGDTSADNYQRVVSDSLNRISLEYKGRIFETYTNKKNGDIGFEFTGFGFWDRITGIIVLSQDLASFRSIQILDQKETPGLGARIEEKSFTDQFKGLKISWNSPVDRRIVIGKSSYSNNNSVDAITGATQTSTELMKVVNSELNSFKNAYEKSREK